MAEGSKAKIGLVGLGYWGKNILRNLYELKAVKIACDSNCEVVKIRKKEFPGISYTLDFVDILKDPKIDAVVISTPASTHYNFIKESLNAGKDVFVEKPLALNVEHGQELVALAKKRNKILMVGHILQYHPAVIKLKELIEKGELGKIQYIYSNRLNIGKLRTEENILWSFAPHDISVILMLVGDEPVRVGSFGGDYLNEGICDVTLSTLEFKNEIRAHIFVSWLHPFKEQKLIVVGSKAMAVFDDLTKEKLFIYPHKIEWENGKVPVAYKAEHYCGKVENKEPLKEEIKHFLDCIKKRSSPKTDGAEGLRVLRVLEEAERFIHKDTAIASNKKYFVHPSSFVDKNAEIGEGTSIWHFSHILNGSRIGKNCKIGQNVVIGPNATVGDGCKIQNNVSVYEGVVLEESVFCGPSCVFTNVFNPRSEIPRKNEIRKTVVKKGATIGANSTIVCGNALGRYSFVGAGAVVTKDIPDYALVYGNPAKIKGWICECGTALEFNKGSHAKCGHCGSDYTQYKNQVARTGRASKNK